MTIALYDWMKKKARTLGTTGIKVSPLSFGSASISSESGGYGFGPMSSSDAMALLEHALELGVNMFDSAPVYGLCEAERRLGTFFKSKGNSVRDKVYLTSKSGVSWHPNGRINMTNDPKVAEEMLLQSLKDLQTEYIDFYFVHWPDSRVDIRRPLEMLARYQAKGAIRYLGLCNTHAQDLELAKEVATIDVVQSEYNLFQRKVEDEILPHCQKENVGFMAWGTLEKGILSGNFNQKKALHPSDNRVGAPWFKSKDVETKARIVEEMKRRGSENFSVMAFALGYLFHQPSVTTLLCGSKTKEQWDSTIRAMIEGEDYFANHKKLEEFLVLAQSWQQKINIS
jgi:myo-inositol catabolism protein IolS